jgi:hypothetical protein
LCGSAHAGTGKQGEDNHHGDQQGDRQRFFIRRHIQEFKTKQAIIIALITKLFAVIKKREIAAGFWPG